MFNIYPSVVNSEIPTMCDGYPSLPTEGFDTPTGFFRVYRSDIRTAEQLPYVTSKIHVLDVLYLKLHPGRLR